MSPGRGRVRAPFLAWTTTILYYCPRRTMKPGRRRKNHGRIIIFYRRFPRPHYCYNISIGVHNIIIITIWSQVYVNGVIALGARTVVRCFRSEAIDDDIILDAEIRPSTWTSDRELHDPSHV